MPNMIIPSLPVPGNNKSLEEMAEYIRQLYSVLSKWQIALGSTGFLGTVGVDSGNLWIKNTAPTSAEGADGDVWVHY